jgi:hypothetical protein
VFLRLEQAEASRELARRWAEENRRDLDFPRVEAAHGEIAVSRAAEEMLGDRHVGDPPRSVAIRRYRLHAGTVDALMRRVDGAFADRLQAMDGFAAWHVFDCGGDEILWISFVRDLAAAEECDERTFRFVSEELREFGLERRVALAGKLLVSRARADLLQPAHA